MLQHVSEPHSFLLLNNIPVCVCVCVCARARTRVCMRVHTFCLFIHWLLDIWVLSTFLGIMNNTAINIHVLVFVWTYVSVLQGMQLGV